jgi:molybdenum cofactor guanylyltransferase
LTGIRHAAVILAGGLSSRMGTSKALLDWDGMPMVEHMCRIVSTTAAPVVVVRAADQRLPPLPEGIETATDEAPERGPLQGLAAGLRAVGGRAAAVFVSAVDAPLLRPGFAAALVAELGPHQAAVPEVDGRLHPLSAVYRPSVLVHVERQLDAGLLRVRDLLQAIDTVAVPAARLHLVDPDLDSLRTMNTPQEYRDALRRR